MDDPDPSKPAKGDLARVPGLLDQYRQQRAAWLAQADELVRMRDEVRQAAEHEALEIVTAARRDVRRIIVEARRELLVLTAQLHAAVEATDAPALAPPPFAGLLADPERARADDASGDPLDLTREVLEARKGVRSVLDEARAEIEALSSEAPAALAAAASRTSGRAESGWPDAPSSDPATAPAVDVFEPAVSNAEQRAEGPVHELNLDSALSALDFQTRDLPIPTLARILGGVGDDSGEQPLGARSGFEPLSFDTPRLSELRALLRDAQGPLEPLPATDRGHVLSPDVEPSPSSPLAFDTTPRSDFFDGLSLRGDEAAATPAPDAGAEATSAALETPPSTAPSRLFGDDAVETRSPIRSARTFIGLFAATGALAVVGTIWWAMTREGPEPLSAASPSAAVEPAVANPAASRDDVSPSAPGTMALTIETRRPSWVRAQVDGKDEVGRIYQAGETRHIEGRSISIRAGDAGAVYVGVDGSAAQPLGPDGRAVTRQFSAAPAPAATPAVDTASETGPSVAPAVASAPIVPADAPLPARGPQPGGSAPAAAAAATDTAPTPGEGVSGARPDLVQAGQQWLAAYQRRDRDAMASTSTENISVSDERSVTERFPAWQSNVRRDLDQVELELTGDTALLTARMTEHADGGGGGEHVSRVSQIWMRRNGRWRLADVRIIGEARLNQIVR